MKVTLHFEHVNPNHDNNLRQAETSPSQQMEVENIRQVEPDE